LIGGGGRGGESRKNSLLMALSRPSPPIRRTQSHMTVTGEVLAGSRGVCLRDWLFSPGHGCVCRCVGVWCVVVCLFVGVCLFPWKWGVVLCVCVCVWCCVSECLCVCVCESVCESVCV